jgi:hypothetical protein
MADGGSQMMDNQAVEDGFVHINGETHVLNYDTNILNLEENREVSPVADVEPLNDIMTGTGSGDEEEEDIEVD